MQLRDHAHRTDALRDGELAHSGADAQLAQGYSDDQIAEVVGLVALQLLTGAFNLVAGIER